MDNKFLFSISFFLLIIGAVFAFSGGGTLENPFIVTNCIELQNINYAPDKDYALANDINCYADTHEDGVLWNDGYGFHSIFEFTGSLIGTNEGKKITGVYMRDYPGNSNAGLFFQLNEALIKDFNLEIDLNISNSGIGGLAGYAKNSIIRNVEVSGKVQGYNRVGGVIGQGWNLILDNVSNKASVFGKNNVGGIIGYNDDVSIFYSTNKGNIKGITNVGGIVGDGDHTKISDCKNTGSIIEGYMNVGGIAGYISNSIILNSINYTEMSPVNPIVNNYPESYPMFVGGIVGAGSGKLENVNNFGDVKGGEIVGGIAGRFSGIITNSNAANVLVIGNEWVSGVANQDIAWNEISICNSSGGVISSSGEHKCNILSAHQYVGDGSTFTCVTNPLALCHGGDATAGGAYCDSSYCKIDHPTWPCLYGKCGGTTSTSIALTKCIGPMHGTDYYFNPGSPYGYSDYDPDLLTTLVQNRFSTTNTSLMCENYCLLDPEDEEYRLIYGELPACVEKDTYGCENYFGRNYFNAHLVNSDEQTGLTKDTTYTLVTSSTSEKCEYVCDEGYFQVGDILTGTCVPYSCTGSVDGNAEMYLNDDVNLTANTPITLVDFNSANKKCEYHCKAGYYRGSGSNSNKCLPYLCTENPSILINDYTSSCGDSETNVILDNNYLKVLVSECTTTRNCEYTCYDYGGDWIKLKVINGITQCWLSYCGNDYCDDGEDYSSCPQDCSLVCAGGDSVCPNQCNYLNDSDCPPCLNTGVCDSNSDCCSSSCVGGSCVPQFATEGICGDGVIDEGENCSNCPEDVICQNDYYCEEGICIKDELDCSSDGVCNEDCPIGVDLDCGCVSVDGSCVSNSDCCSGLVCGAESKCVSTSSASASIDVFNLFVDGNKLYYKIKCNKEVPIDINLYKGEVSSKNLVRVNDVCGVEEKNGLILDSVEEKIIYTAIAKIQPLCKVCTKTDYLVVEDLVNPTSVPDNSLIFTIVVLLSVVFLLNKKYNIKK